METITSGDTEILFRPGQNRTDFAALPELPSPDVARCGDGYDWMDALDGWQVVPLWGRDGYDLGRWPLLILAVATVGLADSPVYGVATYIEGDVTVQAFNRPADTNDAISR
ncbi:hypothetical protein [Calidifontibacter terrae]